MPLVIRLARHGRRNRPFYRVVVAEKLAPRDGKFIELLGNFDPHLDRVATKNIRLNVTRMRYWIAQGAVPSDAVTRLCVKFNLLPPNPIRVHMPIKDVKPEMLPFPGFMKQPLLTDRPERYFSTAVNSLFRPDTAAAFHPNVRGSIVARGLFRK